MESLRRSGESRNPVALESLRRSRLQQDARLDSGLRRNDEGKESGQFPHYFIPARAIRTNEDEHLHFAIFADRRAVPKMVRQGEI